MPNPNMQRLPEALTVLTRPFDWNALLQTPVRIFPDAYSSEATPATLAPAAGSSGFKISGALLRAVARRF